MLLQQSKKPCLHRSRVPRTNDARFMLNDHCSLARVGKASELRHRRDSSNSDMTFADVHSPFSSIAVTHIVLWRIDVECVVFARHSEFGGVSGNRSQQAPSTNAASAPAVAFSGPSGA